MKKTPTANPPDDELLPEYRFDYSKARPNRFADARYREVVRSSSTRTWPKYFQLPSPSTPSCGH